MQLTNLVAALVIGFASAIPSPEGHGALHQLVKRAPQVNGSYIPVTAPRDNLFAGVTEEERASVYRFLQRQKNVTIPGNVEFWDGALMWLLPPNKTDATAYLDNKGPKPGRFVRTEGSGEGFTREYMVGPLPVGEFTKAFPLDYALGGNATRSDAVADEDEILASSDDAEDREDETSHLKRGRRVSKKRSVQRRDTHNPYEEKMEWNGEKLAHDEKAPPVTILPDGARHEFDPKQNYVSWMDFTFFVATGPGGVSLHDIRFKGERIVYELAMQEALAHYAGPDMEQTEASFLDVRVGFTEFNLIPGYDCPAYATYTDAFCLFEFPKDYPMSRHYNYDYFHATKNVAFMLRTVSTVGNYDYQTTYEFHYDGSIQVMVRASGYIQGSDYVNGTEPWEYGYKIRDDLSGSMHDHVLNFKLDLDIKGTKNSVSKTEFVPHSQVYDWSNGKTINTMKVDRSFISSEDEGKIHWAPNGAASYAVVNKDKPNEFGEYPGFKIYPSAGTPIHVTVENSTVFPNVIDWATHPLYALKRKDSEPVAAHPDEGYDTLEPKILFNSFFDGESLDQEDVVIYFNLGMHHMPDTYDLPVTVFQGAQSGITIRPQNYKKSNSAIRTRQQIHIVQGADGKPEVETYGSKELSGSYDLSDANPKWLPTPEYGGDDGEDDGEWEEDS